MKKIIIIGGVAAGMSAAAKAKRLNSELEIVVYEKTNIVSWGACGLPYYVGDFYQDANIMVAREPEQFAKDGIKIKSLHEVIDVDISKREVTVLDKENGRVFSDNYDELIVTTGASAAKLDIKNSEVRNIFNLKDFSDGIELKKEILKSENQKIIIIGAGYIGLEAAEAVIHLGKEVRIIQHSSRVLLGSFDKEITDLMEEELNKTEKLKLHLNEGVQEFLSKDGKVSGVKTDKGEYLADIVIVAIGVKPNTDFLKDKGFEMLKNGALIIDGKGKTNIDGVYAAGDCASVYHKIRRENVYIPLATTSNKIGRVVGEHLAGVEIEFKGTLGSAAIKIMNLEAGRTGITEEEAKSLNIPYGSVFIEDVNQTSYYPGQEPLYAKLIFHNETREILGGQLIGKKGAVLRVDVLAAAIDKNMTIDELGMLDLCYAPPFSLTWDTLNTLGNVAKSKLNKK
ncbi:CoA-disulfide reductase [Fusobacterium necrogenes]|uniref:CoA-disulfide reductase n=1 Tax=Fusobacterium necrogenes TaxID=858 RepID=UPI00255C9237|nr:CoA-disulfide reductase [Fusobacterium necrogenes]